jgi:hypothetical protein
MTETAPPPTAPTAPGAAVDLDRFDTLVGDFGTDRFFAEVFRRTPVHLKNGPALADAAFSWPELDRLINQSSIWSAECLRLVLEGKVIAADRFCTVVPGRLGGTVAQPVADKVRGFLAQGATMVLEDVDALTPAWRRIATALEAATGGKVQANLYVSRAGHQGFGAHFDTHDVFALHLAGEKTWQVYDGRIDRPIPHARFQNLGADFHDAHRGKPLMEAKMAPGDLLYLPRGQYHDALASTDGAVHLALGVNAPIGMDVLMRLFDHAVAEAAFRDAAPRLDGPGLTAEEGDAAVDRWIDHVADRAARAIRGPAVRGAVKQFLRDYHWQRGGPTLPDDLQRGPAAWRLAHDDVIVVDKGGQTLLARGGKGVPVPPALAAATRWIVETRRFTDAELAAAFPDLFDSDRSDLISQLRRMKLLTAAE